MSFKEFRSILPAPQPEIETLEAHQIARNFYREVEHRQDFQKYCQWYYETAQLHQQELQKMRNDINIFGWFIRRRK
ncbi:MAG TPA: hypothetical protein V6D13_15990 [Halomicronema sp.]